jgi:hypothetical protein
MKKWRNGIVGGALAVLLFSGTGIMASEDEGEYGAAAVSEGETYSVEEMLVYAIQDEYMAEASYLAIMDAYGTIKPFTSIAKAEGTHISLLLPLFETYGFEVPENEALKLELSCLRLWRKVLKKAWPVKSKTSLFMGNFLGPKICRMMSEASLNA